MGIGVSDELDRDRLLEFCEGRLRSWSPTPQGATERSSCQLLERYSR